MKVAIDIGPLTSGHKVRGVGFYTKHLVEALGSKVNGVDFSGINFDDYDVLHWPFFNLFTSNKGLGKAKRSVVTIHDVVPLLYPKVYRPGLRGFVNLVVNKRLLKKVSGVITDSETSKKDIVRLLGVPAEKIFPIHLAAGKQFKKLSLSAVEQVGKKYKLPKKYVLYVGDVNYNKNIPSLVKACRTAKVPLVMVGKQASEIDQLNLNHSELRHLKEIKGKTHYACRLGFVSDEDLVALFNLATVYVQPSLYEGFGLPVLQAMACGTPVIINKTNALVEVAGGAAWVVDARDQSKLAEKIVEVMGSKKLIDDMRSKGMKRVAKFSWKKTAQETFNVYEKITGK